MIILETPTIARLEGYTRDQLEKILRYTDKRAQFELEKTRKGLKRFQNARRYIIAKQGAEYYQDKEKSITEHLEAIRSDVKKSLLFEDDRGLFTYSGLANRIATEFSDVVKRGYDLPQGRDFPWDHLPKYKDRDYQTQAIDLLLKNCVDGPVGIELPTGSGKTSVIRNILKQLGLPGLVMTPSISIAGQMYDELVHHFGKKRVGLVGNGKKEFDRMFVVAVDDSLTRVEPNTPAWDALSSKKVFAGDESHLTCADTLQKVCFGLMANAPYRLFCSATQLRNDGLDLVLDGITGKIVFRKTLTELIDEGYLAKPSFKIVNVRSTSNYSGDDAVRMTREHLYHNPIAAKVAADLANNFVSLMQRPTLILVKEIEQFSYLLPHFKHPVKFAHGPITAVNKKVLPVEYHADKPKDLVEQFNEGKIPILVGTSCVATGTDFKGVGAGVYLMGGKSEIELKQGLGRVTRGGFNGSVFNPWTTQRKTDVVWVDMRVDVDILQRHSDQRMEIYKEINDDVSQINMTSETR